MRTLDELLRPHKIYIYESAKKYVILLVIPIARAILSYQDPVSLVVSYMRDITVALLLILYSYLKWRKAGYSLHGGFTLRQGVFHRHTVRIIEQRAASVEIECTPLMHLMGARRVRINTAGLRKRADATIYLPADAVSTQISESKRPLRYSARMLPVIILSASNSNAALGFLTLAPALRNAGKILGRDVSTEFASMFRHIVSLGLPPLLDNMANLLIMGWCFAFIGTFTKFVGFFAEHSGNQLHIISGLITRRDVFIDCDRITAIDLRQTLLMRLFRLYSVSITAAGYGRDRDTHPVIIPAAKTKEIGGALDVLLPEYPTCTGALRPSRRAAAGYALPPLLLTSLGFIPLSAGGVWTMAALVIFIAGGWWLWVRMTGFARAGLGVSSRAISMRYTRGLAIHEIHVPIEVADCALIKRAPWQKRTCTVTLLTFGEKHRRHRVSGLPYDAAKGLVEHMLSAAGDSH